MAGSKVNYTGKIKASTMVEVVVAMAMIMVVFSLAMMIFANVSQSALSVKKVQAEAILRDILLKASQASGNTTQSFNVGDFRIEEVVQNYQDQKNLSEIELTAYDVNQNKVATFQQVIISQHE